eukprot:385456_1
MPVQFKEMTNDPFIITVLLILQDMQKKMGGGGTRTAASSDTPSPFKKVEALCCCFKIFQDVAYYSIRLNLHSEQLTLYTDYPTPLAACSGMLDFRVPFPR